MTAVTCDGCAQAFSRQPADFLRYDRWRDRWVASSEEDGTVLPPYGVCRPCQDRIEADHAAYRYGGPNHQQIEQRLIEDEQWVWDQ